MTQVFDANGRQSNVTVLQVGPCTAVQVKTLERDGYAAVQLGFDPQKEQRLTKPEQGHLKKAGAPPLRTIREFALQADEQVQPGDTFTVELFEGVSHVDVVANSKGRGFQGVVRRHGFAGGRATHGSGMHRKSGSIGMKISPSRVFKGKPMPGHMGNRRVTTQNLRVVAVRPEDHAILVEGAVPGPTGGLVTVRKAIKKVAKAS